MDEEDVCYCSKCNDHNKKMAAEVGRLKGRLYEVGVQFSNERIANVRFSEALEVLKDYVGPNGYEIIDDALKRNKASQSP